MVNLGTPDSYSTRDVARYLRIFLSDSRVLDISPWVRIPLVYGIIAPWRARRVSKRYRQLWLPEGAPLRYHTQQIVRQLQQKTPSHTQVLGAMRYGSPSLDKALRQISQMPIHELIVLPLFPQYASATSGSVFEYVLRRIQTWHSIPQLRLIPSFYDHPAFIHAWAARIQTAFSDHKAQYLADIHRYDHVLFSYHGLPESQIKKGSKNGHCKLNDSCCRAQSPHTAYCYRAHCIQTTEALVQRLALKPNSYTTCFQSRLGPVPWLKPYTDATLCALAQKGLQNVLVLSPSFVCDCLETTIEIGDEYRSLFRQQGGTRLDWIPSLNATSPWIDALAAIMRLNT